MPGNYSHNTITNGTVLSDTRYNADHQNHIDNHTPLGLDDYSANVAQMQSTVDPGEVGSESLATSTAGELERIRFAIKEIRGTAHWYVSATTKVTGVDTIFNHSQGPISGWLDGVQTIVSMFRTVPHDWAGGDLTMVVTRRSAVTTGTARMSYGVVRYRSGAAPATITATTAINYTPADTHTQFVSLTVPGGSYVSGDMILVTVERLGADGADTLSASLEFNGAYLQYTGFAGRG